MSFITQVLFFSISLAHSSAPHNTGRYTHSSRYRQFSYGSKQSASFMPTSARDKMQKYFPDLTRAVLSDDESAVKSIRKQLIDKAREEVQSGKEPYAVRYLNWKFYEVRKDDGLFFGLPGQKRLGEEAFALVPADWHWLDYLFLIFMIVGVLYLPVGIITIAITRMQIIGIATLFTAVLLLITGSCCFFLNISGTNTSPLCPPS